MVTAASELARNALVHGGGGMARVEVVTPRRQERRQDRLHRRGPGHRRRRPGPDRRLEFGVGLGLGLSGARRLVDEFELTSKPGTGTSVVVVKWSR